MSNKPHYYLGLMSGTSADGVDIALVDFSSTKKAKLIAFDSYPFEPRLKQQITALYLPNDNELDRAGQLHIELAHVYAEVINHFLVKLNIDKEEIIAVGNHGQTVRHRPNLAYPFTLQLGCNQTLACLTGLRVIGNFREKDIALGGQGAPLVPAVHKHLFASKTQDTIVVNIGGIANLTYLPVDSSAQVIGYDTGPGNALLDDWYGLHHDKCSKGYDENGKWASRGAVVESLLEQLLSHPYFSLPAPKSSGREEFHLPWLNAQLLAHESKYGQLSPVDVQATLVAFTAQSIATECLSFAKQARLVVCGGGAQNTSLMKSLASRLTAYETCKTDDLGVSSDAVEALAFAWLGYAFDHSLMGNLPSVTGAKKATVLGVQYRP